MHAKPHFLTLPVTTNIVQRESKLLQSRPILSTAVVAVVFAFFSINWEVLLVLWSVCPLANISALGNTVGLGQEDRMEYSPLF